MIDRLKFIYLITLTIVFSSAYSQTYNSEQVDGEIYLKYKNDYDLSALNKNNSNPTDFIANPVLPGLDANFSADFGIYKITMPFKAAFSKDLKQVLQVSFKEPAMIDELIELLSAYPYVEYAEPVPYNSYSFQPNDMQSNSTGGQWGLWKINAREAWDLSKGDSTITVAIIDDGVSMFHPDLYGNVWRNPGEIAGNNIDDDNNGYVDDIYGWDAGNNDNNPVHPSTNFTHGTHVGGIAGAVTNNMRGVASIGYNISIIPVKCTFDNQSSTTAIPQGYAGITYAANAGADIINCSWSGSGFSQTAQTVINYATSRGSIVVAAASNNGVNQIRYPAAYDGVIAVASSDINDRKSNFSNYGTWVDVTAPGSRIRSTIAAGNSYATFDGTSMASPMVAGLLGLMKSHNPNLTNVQLEQCLLDNADDIDGLNTAFAGFLGSGRINAEKSMECVDKTLKAKPVAQLKSNISVTCPGVDVAFTGSSSSQGKAQSFKWYFPNGSPSTSTQANPIVSYNAIGTYNVALVVSNIEGSDSIFLKDYINVAAQGKETLYSEDFENGSLNAMGFTIENPDNGITWSVANVSSSPNGSKALRMNFYNYSQIGERDGLITPVIDLSGNADAVLSFQHAYRARNANKRDSLIIYASTDSGKTFPHRVASMGSFSTNAGLTSSFTPSNESDWCVSTFAGTPCNEIDLSDFDGEKNMVLKFVAYNDFGNNLYIDNISVRAFCSGFNTKKPDAGFANNDTAFCLPNTVKFSDNSQNFPTSYEWIFEGGTPATSTDKNPEVTYTSAGIYDVTLITGNQFGYDTLEMKQFIEAEDVPTVVVSAGKSVLCRGESTKLYATGAQEFAWSPVFAISSTSGDSVVINPPTSITYNVKGTSANGCSSTETISITILPGPGVTSITKVNDSLVADNSNSSVTFQWQFNGVDINGATGRSHRPTQEGNYRVVATDSSGCANNSLNFFFSTIGIAELSADAIKVYPNPAKEQLFIDNSFFGESIDVKITDNLGKVIINAKANNELTAINISQLKSGVYFVTLRNNRVNQTRKIIVSKQ
jgi:subtilisin family serine protease